MLFEAAAVLVLLVLLARWKSPEIYDIVIIHMTERWYSEVLGRLEAGQHVLDVGIGTGGALCTPANAALVATNRLKIVGIDYEERYIAKAKAASASAGLSEALKVHCASVYDPSLPEMVGKDFDCAYFSGSFSLLPDPSEALRAVAALLKPGGVIYITQTFQRRALPGMSVVKPLMKYCTTIDFGQLVFEREAVGFVERAGMELVENVVVPRSVDNSLQVARLIVARPKRR
jgi:ubiquinone/menaquinone biosynthesis C-methylase UbiE